MVVADWLFRARALIKEMDTEARLFVGSRPPEAIEMAERSLGCRFPRSYREFLSELGGGYVYGEDIFGLMERDGVGQGYPDVVWVTKDLRKIAGIACSLVAISEDGMGSYYVLDTEKTDETGECPVVVRENKTVGLTEHVSDSFKSFFCMFWRRIGASLAFGPCFIGFQRLTVPTRIGTQGNS